MLGATSAYRDQKLLAESAVCTSERERERETERGEGGKRVKLIRGNGVKWSLKKNSSKKSKLFKSIMY